jgi:hypothetical protein
MTKRIQELLLKTLGVIDPVSMSEIERQDATQAQDFFSIPEEDLVQAYSSLGRSLKLPHMDDLFVFLINVRRYSEAYQESGELWTMFEECTEPQLVVIHMDQARNTEHVGISQFKEEQLIEMSHNERFEMWAQHHLVRLKRYEGKIMLLLFTDDEMSKRHGFPFDVLLTSRPNDDLTGNGR